MQQNFIEQWESISQASLELLKNVSESNKSAFVTVLNGQSSLGAWGKLAKLSLDASKAIVDMNTSSFNNALRNELKGKELDAVADSVEELGSIVSSLATTLAELQVATFKNVALSYANSLRSLNNVASADEIVAVQAHLQADLEEKLKLSAKETLQTFSALNSGLTDWVTSSVEKLAGDKVVGIEP